MHEIQGKLREIAQETINRCCLPKQAEYCGRSGIRRVFLPAGDEKYGSFWPVDAIFSSRCGLMDNELLKDIIDIIFTHGQNGEETRYLMHGLEVPPYAIADHINLDGKPVFFPGTYSSGEDQGDGAFGYYPPLNNLYLVAELVDRYISQSGDTEILEKQYRGKPLKICLKEAFFAPYALDPRTELCCGREVRHVVDWTYCDQVKKSGLFLAPSLMRAQAAEILARYFPKEAERYCAIQKQIVKNLIAELYDEKTGWFYSATGIGRQKDIWGTAYGVYSGVLPDAVCRKSAQALSEAYAAGSATCRGYVRHILTTEDHGKESAWENCFTPYNSYMNGGYWATPSGWFAAALYRHDPSLARKFVEEFVEFTLKNREDGAPYEWFHPQTGDRSGRYYGTSGTALYAVVKDWSIF